MNGSFISLDGCVQPDDPKSPSPSDSGVTVAGKRKSGRRSWFTPNKNIRFEIAVDPREQRQNVEDDEEVQELVLTHFTEPPKVSKCDVKIPCFRFPDYTEA